MKKLFIIDYVSYILLRFLGPFVRSLSPALSLALGRAIGELAYAFDARHRAVAFANVKTAFGAERSPCALKRIVRESYRAFGQNLIEVFFIPAIDRDYIRKYISVEGLAHVEEAFRRGKGVIFAGIHEGSWELSNIISANLGFPVNLLIQNQEYPRLNGLLNSYRSLKGCRIIQRQDQTKRLIEVLKANEAVGMTMDQGGKSGVPVKFFGKEASMSTGAVRLALKYGCALLPVFFTRTRGAYVKIFIEPAFELKKTGDQAKDIRDNVQGIIGVFEKYIRVYPKEYLWSYKVWKYSGQRSILLLSDGKTGHLRQSQAVAALLQGLLKKNGIRADIDTKEIGFRSSFGRRALTVCGVFSGTYSCQGCMQCLKGLLAKETYGYLMGKKYDYIVSCGSSLAAVNLLLSRENRAKSITIMRPSLLSIGKFDLAVMPRHDNPPKRKNVVTTDGALNLINPEYLNMASQALAKRFGLKDGATVFSIGLLLGGDTKDFSLSRESVSEAIAQIKAVTEKLDARILVTTSRRTSGEVQRLVKGAFKGYPRAAAVVIANEENVAEAVGGILGLSNVAVVSAESISMISEAASSGRFVVVFGSSALGGRHGRFLKHMAKERYVYLSPPGELSSVIEGLYRQTRPPLALNDAAAVEKALERIV